MDLKHLIILLTLFSLISIANAQFDMNNKGMVQLTTNTLDWESGLRTIVPTYNSVAYNLMYHGHDVFFVHASGYLWCERGGYFGSDSTFKRNIHNIESPISKLIMLHGVAFNFKNDSSNMRGYESESERFGLIAQEVETLFPGIVKTLPNGTKGIAYTDLIALIIEAVKSQQTQIVALNSRCLELEDVIQSCCHSFYGNDNPQTQKALNVSGDSENFLFQNIPNPFSETTTIRYRINDKAQSYSIVIFNAQGSLLRSYKTLKTGENQLTLQAKEFTPGIYLYSLIVDGKEIDTKRMILTN